MKKILVTGDIGFIGVSLMVRYQNNQNTRIEISQTTCYLFGL